MGGRGGEVFFGSRIGGGGEGRPFRKEVGNVSPPPPPLNASSRSLRARTCILLGWLVGLVWLGKRRRWWRRETTQREPKWVWKEEEEEEVFLSSSSFPKTAMSHALMVGFLFLEHGGGPGWLLQGKERKRERGREVTSAQSSALLPIPPLPFCPLLPAFDFKARKEMTMALFALPPSLSRAKGTISHRP